MGGPNSHPRVYRNGKAEAWIARRIAHAKDRTLAEQSTAETELLKELAFERRSLAADAGPRLGYHICLPWRCVRSIFDWISPHACPRFCPVLGGSPGRRLARLHGEGRG